MLTVAFFSEQVCTEAAHALLLICAAHLTAAGLEGPGVVLVNAAIHGPVVGKDRDDADAALAGLVDSEVQAHQHLLIIDPCA